MRKQICLAVALLIVGAWCLAGGPRPVKAQFGSCGSGFCETIKPSGGTVNNMTVDATQSGCPTSASPTLGYSTNQANDIVVLFVQPGNAGQTVTSVTQPGLTWTQRATTATGSNNIYEYWALTGAAFPGGATVTINLSASAFAIMQLIAIHGANTSSPFDPNGALPNLSGSGADAVVTTTNSATLPIAAYLTGSTGSPTAGAGFTAIATGGCFGLMEYKTSFPTTPQSSLHMSLTTGGGLQTVGIGDAITQ